MKLVASSLPNAMHPLTRRNLIAGGGAMFLLSGCAGGIDKAVRTSGVLDAEMRETPLDFDFEEGFAKLNAVRRKYLLPEFRNDPRLQTAAQNYADLMAEKGKYGHEIGRGTDFKTRIFAVGFKESSGENLGVGYNSIDKAIEGWLDSRPHRKAMLRRKYELAGLAYAFNNSGRNPRYTHLWVLIMGADDGMTS